MKKEDFINSYVVTFLASYAAVKYDENCLYGRNHSHGGEDAQFLAEEAWEALEKL